MAQGRSQKLVDDRAREWFMLRHERHLSPREETEFKQWMAEPAHSASFRQLEQIEQGLRAIAASGEGQRLRAQPDSWPGSWKVILRDFFARVLAPAPALAMGLVMVVAVGMVSVGDDRAPWHRGPAVHTYASEIAQTRTVTLEDGSEVTLGAGSQIEASLGEQRRDVVLVKGEAFFSVAGNPDRPFYVTAGDTRVRVVGTRFEVHRAPGSVKVAVEEGVVDVSRTDSDPAEANDGKEAGAVRLLAGQGVRMGDQVGGNVEAVKLDELAGWRQGKLIYRDARLAEVVADANRYREGQIVLGAPQLADLRVTTSFSASQVETMISMLEQSLPVSVYREAGNRVVIWPR